MWLNTLKHEGRVLNEENIASCKDIRITDTLEVLYSELYENVASTCEKTSQFEVLESSCTERSYDNNAYKVIYIDCTDAEVGQNMLQDDSVNDMPDPLATGAEVGQNMLQDGNNDTVTYMIPGADDRQNMLQDDNNDTVTYMIPGADDGQNPRKGGPGIAARKVHGTVVYYILLYGVQVWYEQATQTEGWAQMERANREILLRVCRGFKSMSTAAAEMLAGIPPARLRARELADSGRRRTWNAREMD